MTWVQREARKPLILARRGGINGALNQAATVMSHFVPEFWPREQVVELLIDWQKTAWLASGGSDDGDLTAARKTIASGLNQTRDPWRATLVEPGETKVPDPELRSSWKPVDVTSVLNGEHSTITASIGEREDGVHLLYPGREHSVASEPEAGKTWLALHIVRAELKAGGRVVYIDFEDDEGGIVGRLVTLGTDHALLADQNRLRYVRPECEPAEQDYESLLAFPGEQGPTLVVLDGVTEGYSLFGGEINSQEDAAKWRKVFVKPATHYGAATLSTDHVVKNTDNRGGYAIGAQHKKAGLNGVLFELRAVDPFGKGLVGRSKVLINKDRNGDLRQHGARVKDERAMHFADLVLDATDVDVSLRLYPPVGSDGGPATDPLGHVKAKVCVALEGRSRTARDLRALTRGLCRDTDTDAAALQLQNQGLLCRREYLSKTGRAQLGPWHKVGQCTDELHPEGIPKMRGVL